MDLTLNAGAKRIVEESLTPSPDGSVSSASAGMRPRFWRSLDEHASAPVSCQHLQPQLQQIQTAAAHPAQESFQPLNRREVLKLMAASAAFAGLTGCTKLPTEHIVPYVRQPEDILSGQPVFYATAMTLGGVASGVLVESHMGRPTKIEGNPDHPASQGATDAFTQAAVLSLYDPDRSQAVIHDGRVASWNDFQQQITVALEQQKAKKGAGLRLLTETITSPSLAAQIQSLLAAYPSARWHQYESVNRDSAGEGAKLAFGESVNAVYRVDQARVILALDSDFLCYGPGCVRYARDFARTRRLEGPQGNMSRLYSAEVTPTNTGAMADHRLRLRASEIESFTRALAQQLGIQLTAGQAISSAVPAMWIPALVRELQQARGASLVVAGDQQPPVVHALVHSINQSLGNFDKTIYFTAPIEASPSNQWQSVNELAVDLRAGQVELLLVIGGNPAYDAPADLAVKDLLPAVKFSARLGLYEDETSALCHWHIPQTHYLEEWGDARAFDGTISLIQPLIAPLYDGKSACELLALLNGEPGQSSHDIVREHWRTQKSIGPKSTPTAAARVSSPAASPNQQTGAGFDTFWKQTLRDGVMAGTAFPPQQVTLKLSANSLPQPSAASQGLEIVFRPDPTVWDGRFANNGWLQELGKPLTRLTWDAAATFSPETAQRLGLKNEDTVELQYQGRTIRAPVWVMPGHANETVTAFLGYGRTRSGHVGTGVGFDAGWIRPLSTQWFGSGLGVKKVGGRWALAAIEHHDTMEGRDLVRVATLDEYRKNPTFAQFDVEKNPASLYPPAYNQSETYQWGMSIDLTSCTGCSACVIACQAENNIAVVGKEQVLRGREMHWIRIDRYYQGEAAAPSTYFEPVPCMQCEDAPCELVCPVGATQHSSEGLNEMVYNRCVGTRYCSNNCPYKVRRFNFLLFSDWNTQSLYGLRNPNVTVRSRGVMEKCTYCVQRINAAKIEAEEQDRTIRDGEIVTACQQACPTEAIIFGNIADPNSRVSKLKAKPLDYRLLEELNARPRTTYLARVRNPNPEMPEGTA